MRLLLRPSEQLSAYLAVAIMSLLALNFLTAYHISQVYEPRFLFSGLLLGGTAIFLRFGQSEVRMLHRAGFRIATVMALWSLGFFIFPNPGIIIYLLVFPGFYFLLRIEIKDEGSTNEDIAAALILFVIALFLFIEQQPLHVLLFPDLIFNEAGYYTNAPAVVAIGLGLIRLQRWLAWPGLALTGVLCIYVGSVFSSSLIDINFWHGANEIFFAICYGLFLLLAVSTKLVQHTGLKTISHLSDEQIIRLQLQLYWAINLALQACVGYLLIYGGQSTIELIIMILAPLALLVHYQRFTVTLLLLQWALFVSPLGLWTFPQLDKLLMLPLALFLLITLILRRSRYSGLAPNYGLVMLSIHYYVTLSLFSLMTPLGLIALLFPFLIWMGIPSRPLRIKRQHHYLLWPPLSAISILCFAGEYQAELLILWSLLLIHVPIIFFVLITRENVQTWLNNRKLLFFVDWLRAMDRTLIILSILALVAAVTGFVLAQDWFVSSWVPILASMSVIFVTLVFSIHLVISKKRLIYVYASEVLIWLGLALLRWKFDVIEMWRFDVNIEGYVLIAAGFVVAGLREVLTTRSDDADAQIITLHFARVTYIYSALGWFYILYLQFSGQGIDQLQLSSLAMAALFYWVSRSQNRVNLILVAVFINIALLTFFYDAALLNPQFYILPTLSTVLVLAHLFSDNLTDQQQQQIRLVCGIVMIGCSSYFNILDFNSNLWYPVTAALISSLAVVLGIGLQIRIYLLLGFGFFVLNTLAVVVHTILNQPPQMLRLIVGLIFLMMGLGFLGSYLLFQMKRKEILAQYHFYQNKIKQWR